ncbi:MAG: YggS family pyridoxal phosphate-dependent enzyme [Butyrivibrio sp.]
MLKENLKSVQERIRAAALKAGRNPDEITLIAVSKTKPVDMIQEIYDAGIREFGENKVQEITSKKPQLPDDINWHMIGHLQRNKVRAVIDKACLIHSVDSLRLAQAISTEAVKSNMTVSILLEVNMAGEETKFGFKPDEVHDALQSIAGLPGIYVRGLMTSAPYVSNPEENRQYFRDMRQLCVDLKAKNIDNTSMDYLSMGMTNDFEVAVEEGATHVRVGTAIFGERNYNTQS